MSEGVYELAVGIDDAYGKSFGAFADGDIDRDELEAIATSTLATAGVAACAALTAGLGTLVCGAVVPVIAEFLGRYIAVGIEAIVGERDYCSSHRDSPECTASNEDRLAWQSVRLALLRAMGDAIDTLVAASQGYHTAQSACYELAGTSIYWTCNGTTPEQMTRIGLGGEYRTAPTVAHMRERLAVWDATYRAALADLASNLTRALGAEAAKERSDTRIVLAGSSPPRLRSAPRYDDAPLPPAGSSTGGGASYTLPVVVVGAGIGMLFWARRR